MKGVSYDSLFSVASIQERKDRSNDFCPAEIRDFTALNVALLYHPAIRPPGSERERQGRPEARPTLLNRTGYTDFAALIPGGFNGVNARAGTPRPTVVPSTQRLTSTRRIIRENGKRFTCTP